MPRISSISATVRTVAAMCGLVLALAIALPLATPAPAAAKVSPFNTAGMWVWYINQAQGGRLDKIAFHAKRFRTRTIFIKSGDGSNYWEQFDRAVVPLKQMGLRVCAWQYVYGANPLAEADVGARAVAAGAECLVIDAESEYKNRYAAAQTYISALRAKIGSRYPLGLTSFAYNDFHPNVPYSVFLGPGGAQWNLPQMYFKAFGQSVSAVFARTYRYNQVYQRRIRPLGQTYDGVRRRQILQFRKSARLYRARGYSWWVWHLTRRDAWNAMRRKLRRSRKRAPREPYPLIRPGTRSDLVRWAQMHLAAAGYPTVVDSNFGPTTVNLLKQFQLLHRMAPTGVLDDPTWAELLKVDLPMTPLPGPTGPSGAAQMRR